MKKFSYLFFALLLAVGCDDGNNEQTGKQIEISNPSEIVQQGYADDQTTGGFTFTAKSAWTATVAAKTRASGVSWLRLLLDGAETYSGDAGTFTLTIEIDANYTGETRSATVTVTSGNDKIIITVTQNGETKNGETPEKPKLIAKIVETATFNSDYYSSVTYAPHYYEFKYDEQDRLKEYYVKEKNGTTYYKVAYSYDIQGEIRLTDDSEDTNVVPLNSMGYIASVDIPYYEGRTYTYNSEGYLQKITSDYYDYSSPYEFIWSGGNPVMMRMAGDEWNDDRETPSTFSAELNNKTTIDLNVFFFGLTGTSYLFEPYFTPSYDAEYLTALIGLAGKRAKNYMISKKYDLDYGNANMQPYTERTEPAVGSVVYTGYGMDFYGEGGYTFDSEGYPATFSHQVEVVKVQYIYNGVREYIDTGGNESYERHLEELYGPGPWFYIKLDAAPPVTKYDTYTYTISYNK